PPTPSLTSSKPTIMAEEESSDQDIKSKRVTLADLSAKGAALYGEKKYEDAADVFSKASTLQASINGETAPENAEILFHYGRSLFKVGQSKSDVLGGPATAVAVAADSKTGADEGEVKGKDAKKPLFQFTGDENFDQEEDEAEEDEDAEAAEDEGEEDAPDDELAMAFEILDLARVCYLKQLQNHEASSDKDKSAQDPLPPALRHMKERLADTHDCLAEISLENERYQDAIEDGRVSLKYKKELYPEDSEIIAEAHYKLSLALEFASVNPASDAANEEDEKEKKEEGESSKGKEKKPAVDQSLRDEAIEQLNLAIKSIRLKLQNNEVELATMASPEDNDAARKAIADMKDVVADMEQKLADLKENPLGATGLLNTLASSMMKDLGSAPSSSSAAAAAALDVNDLVRRKRKAVEDGGVDDEGKRDPDADPSSPSKKVKMDESLTVDAGAPKAGGDTAAAAAEAADASSKKANLDDKAA
ncbi:hypothetical protein CP532_0933, partial [Ophiocordyceps camponoti-leonardi (nom. inval.)]